MADCKCGCSLCIWLESNIACYRGVCVNERLRETRCFDGTNAILCSALLFNLILDRTPKRAFFTLTLVFSRTLVSFVMRRDYRVGCIMLNVVIDSFSLFKFTLQIGYHRVRCMDVNLAKFWMISIYCFRTWGHCEKYWNVKTGCLYSFGYDFELGNHLSHLKAMHFRSFISQILKYIIYSIQSFWECMNRKYFLILILNT